MYYLYSSLFILQPVLTGAFTVVEKIYILVYLYYNEFRQTKKLTQEQNLYSSLFILQHNDYKYKNIYTYSIYILVYLYYNNDKAEEIYIAKEFIF